MKKSFVQKNIKLSMEFDQYLLDHPELEEKIPNGAYIIITIDGDQQFNESSVSMLRNIQSKNIVEACKNKKTWSLRPLKVPQLENAS